MAAHTVKSVFRSNLFAGKTAIVTGGATGIGKAITEELLYLGCQVMIASRKLEQLRKSAEEIKLKLPDNKRDKLQYVSCNIRKEDEVQNLIETTLRVFGNINFLVNNAGGQFPMPASSISLKGWNAVVETNLTGTFLCCKEVYNQWMQQNGGVIVNIIADMWKGMPGMSHSGAARAGVDNLTKTMAIEWAANGIRVNAVAPGSSIYSDSARDNYKKVADDIFQQQIPNIPAKRLGTPEEISACVCFLLSPAAAFITGETMCVDGGHKLYAVSTMWQIPHHETMPAYSWKEQPIDDSKSKSKL